MIYYEYQHLSTPVRLLLRFFYSQTRMNQTYVYIDGENFRRRLMEFIQENQIMDKSQEFNYSLFNFRQFFKNITGKNKMN